MGLFAPTPSHTFWFNKRGRSNVFFWCQKNVLGVIFRLGVTCWPPVQDVNIMRRTISIGCNISFTNSSTTESLQNVSCKYEKTILNLYGIRYSHSRCVIYIFFNIIYTHIEKSIGETNMWRELLHGHFKIYRNLARLTVNGMHNACWPGCPSHACMWRDFETNCPIDPRVEKVTICAIVSACYLVSDDWIWFKPWWKYLPSERPTNKAAGALWSNI